MHALLWISSLFFPIVLVAGKRTWNDTGVGSIVFEEAWTPVELASQNAKGAPPVGQTAAELLANLLDIHNQRLAEMDSTGVDFMVLSCSSPCIQGIADPSDAASLAVSINTKLASQISNNTMRFGAFAALAMHDPVVAAQELNRTVKELGFLGGLINDYQQAGSGDNVTFIYYDQPEFDVFWQMVVDLDVPIYFHPRHNPDPVSTLLFSHAPWLSGPGQEFAVTLSDHLLGLCTNGVFDRFPTLKVISGHLGERIPSDLLRINEQLARQISAGMPMQKNITFYLQHNLFETTSGNFATDLVQFHAAQIGLDRILYSIDYPYVSMQEGAQWIDHDLPASGVLTREEVLRLKRGLAIQLLGLDRR